MEMKEHLSVYLESGYLFDDMSGRLKGNYFIRPENVLKRARASLRQNYQCMMFLSHYMGSFQ